MAEIGNNMNPSRARLVFRISHSSLLFSVVDHASETQVVFEPYVIKSGISLAANLREAFAESDLLNRGYQRAQVMIDSNVMIVPVEEFDEQSVEEMYHHTFTGYQKDAVIHAVLPDLNAVAVFSINKDLRLVITDHFSDVRYCPLTQPVWSYLHKRSFIGSYQKMYAYFHDKSLEIFSFRQNRFKFCNTFNVSHPHDSIYFLLYIWKTLALDMEKDELHIMGNVPEREWLTEGLHRYLQKVYFINPPAEFNRSPISQIKDMPFDLMTLFLKGK